MRLKSLINLLIIFPLIYISCKTSKMEQNYTAVNLMVYGNNVGLLKSSLLSQFEVELNSKKIYNTERKVPTIGIIYIHLKNGEVVTYKVTSGNVVQMDSNYYITKNNLLEKYWNLDEESLLSYQ